jgi:hypothetical protein
MVSPNMISERKMPREPVLCYRIAKLAEVTSCTVYLYSKGLGAHTLSPSFLLPRKLLWDSTRQTLRILSKHSS